MTNQTTIPFTYYVAWTNLDKHYYGVKYAIGCNPSDLWTNYFTSSKLVEQYRQEHGEPDIIEVRKTFDNSLDAVMWEKNVLMKLDVVNNDRWLNQVISGLWDLSHEQRSEIISTAQLNYYANADELDLVRRNESISKGRKRYIANRTPEQKKRDYAARLVGASKSGEAISKAAKERYACNEYRQRLKDAHNTDEYKANASARTKKLFEDEQYKANHTASVTTQAYKDKISAANKKRFENYDARKQVSESLKAHCDDPQVRAQMSLNAKKSTGNRLATRYMNKISDSDLMSTHIDDIIKQVTKQVKQEFDIERLTVKINKRLSIL